MAGQLGMHEEALPHIDDIMRRIEALNDELRQLEGKVQYLHDEGYFVGDAAEALITKYAQDSKIQIQNHENMHTMLQEHRTFIQEQLDLSQRMAQRTLG